MKKDEFEVIPEIDSAALNDFINSLPDIYARMQKIISETIGKVIASVNEIINDPETRRLFLEELKKIKEDEDKKG